MAARHQPPPRSVRRDIRPGPAARAAPSTPEVLALACFFLSGAAGLIAEVCWIRRAALAFGSTTHAVSTVLAVFFGGLAIGSVLFGERSQRSQRPLRTYALLELTLA